MVIERVMKDDLCKAGLENERRTMEATEKVTAIGERETSNEEAVCHTMK